MADITVMKAKAWLDAGLSLRGRLFKELSLPVLKENVQKPMMVYMHTRMIFLYFFSSKVGPVNKI